ncbi:hypothetical protein G9F73_008345 [Clostridium estertheticum]|uniref:hypothetical protein n=1 Tax=Clostridium estertheticum TaxID=238834 RepID=UPI001CCE21FC|nr:hypothetical protein [Clostridium estertheticum]MBZ9607821.1 hypothetical protein [Clostridium estertheticum]
MDMKGIESLIADLILQLLSYMAGDVRTTIKERQYKLKVIYNEIKQLILYLKLQLEIASAMAGDNKYQRSFHQQDTPLLPKNIINT